MQKVVTKRCSVCQSEFACGAAPGGAACWCKALPPLISVAFDQDCRCRACLTQAIVERISVSSNTHSTAAMVDMARPYFNPDQLIEDIDYTIEQGNYVFSAWYHLKRGACCGNGCRHCPYHKENHR